MTTSIGPFERRALWTPRNLVAGVLIAVAAFPLAFVLDRSAASRALSLGVLYLVLCGVVIWREAFRNKHRDLFSPLTFVTAYHALGVGFKGVVSILAGESKIANAIDPTSPQFADLMAQVFFFGIVGLLSMVAGDRLARRHERDIAMTCPAPLLDRRSVRGAVALGAGLSGFGAAVMIAKFGTIILTNPTFIAVQGTFGLFWLYPLMYAGLFAWATPVINQWSAGLRASRWHLLAIAVTSVFLYTLTSSKAVLVICVLLLVIGHHRAVRPVRLRMLAGLGAAFLIALPLLYLHREYGLTAESISRITPGMALAGGQIFFGRSYLADSFGAVLMYTPRVYPYRLGATWLELFYFWVPRAVWPTKPLSASLDFGHTYMSSFFERTESYFSPSLLGDAYLNLGPIGIVLVYLVLGYVFRRWYHRLMGPAARPETVMLYGVSAYWIGIGSEQSVAVVFGLAFSYLAVASAIAIAARRGYLAFGR
jgi:hypothetical protein